MSEEPRRPAIKVEDKRHSSRPEGAHAPAPGGGREPSPLPEPGSASDSAPAESAHDYLDDYLRLRAEFDNYRKRMLREQTQMATRAAERLIERLLPVLDNFEAALAHGEGGPGIEMVHKQLKATLAEEGLEEIPAEGVPFDPVVHEAFEAHEDSSVDEPTSVKVFRRGYRLKDHVIRHAMVSVARPAETEDTGEEAAEG